MFRLDRKIIYYYIVNPNLKIENFIQIQKSWFIRALKFMTAKLYIMIRLFKNFYLRRKIIKQKYIFLNKNIYDTILFKILNSLRL